MSADVKEMRTRILLFVESKGGIADRSQLREHVGVPAYQYSPLFNQAVKTKKLKPIYGDGEIMPNVFLSRPPVLAYQLTCQPQPTNQPAR